MVLPEIERRASDALLKSGLLEEVQWSLETFDDDRVSDFYLQIDAMLEYGVDITSELIERILEVIGQTVYIECDYSLFT